MPTDLDAATTALENLIIAELAQQFADRITVGEGAKRMAKAIMKREACIVKLATAVTNTTPRGEPVLVDFEAFNKLDEALRTPYPG